MSSQRRLEEQTWGGAEAADRQNGGVGQAHRFPEARRMRTHLPQSVRRCPGRGGSCIRVQKEWALGMKEEEPQYHPKQRDQCGRSVQRLAQVSTVAVGKPIHSPCKDGSLHEVMAEMEVL